MIGIIVGILIAIITLSLIFNSLNWIIGILNRNLNESQRTTWGIYVTLFFILMIFMKGCTWSDGKDKLEEKRQTVWRENIPHGYYNPESSNYGDDEPIKNNSNINRMNDEIDAYDEKMAGEMMNWMLGYVILVIIGYVGSIIYPLDERAK